MKKISITLDDKVDIYEFKKVISFISEKIIDYDISQHNLTINVDDTVDEEIISSKIQSYYKKFIVSKDGKCIYHNDTCTNYHNMKLLSDEGTVIKEYGNGLFGLNGIAIDLFRYFDQKFKTMALDSGATEKMYPVLLPVEGYSKTGYLKNSPQYSMFCSSAVENMDVLESLNEKVHYEKVIDILCEPRLALSPSACFHTYIEYEGKELKMESVFTFLQSVFRNEGRLNYSELGRLNDYHVREVVFVGSEEFVINKRKSMINKVMEFMQMLNLSGDISVASDPFILPRMQKMKKIQKATNAKYEVHLKCSEESKISVASFNLHGTAFTYPFSISVKDVENTVTGCVGFGIERWVIAFICQYGLEDKYWPQAIRNEIYK